MTDVWEEREKEWREWCATRPPKVREVAERFTPWFKYRIKSTGQLCHVFSFDEPENDSDPVTLTVNVPSEWNPDRLTSLMFADTGGHQVFGLKPEDLELVAPAAEEKPQ